MAEWPSTDFSARRFEHRSKSELGIGEWRWDLYIYIPANSYTPSVPWILWAKKTLGDSISQMLKWDDGIFTKT